MKTDSVINLFINSKQHAWKSFIEIVLVSRVSAVLKLRHRDSQGSPRGLQYNKDFLFYSLEVKPIINGHK